MATRTPKATKSRTRPASRSNPAPRRSARRERGAPVGATPDRARGTMQSMGPARCDDARVQGGYPASRERKELYPFTISGQPIKPLYGPEDLAGMDLARDVSVPGEYPFTRGIHPTMYRGRMFTMRQFAGFGTARESNQRYHYLLEHGQTGLSIAFDNPTIMGYDSDHPKAHGEVGKCGVAVDSLRDMEILLDGIDPGVISTSMTINGPASIMFGFYLANADKRGVPFSTLRGTLQNDILKEYIAQKRWCFPPEPLRIIVDLTSSRRSTCRREHDQRLRLPHPRSGLDRGPELVFTLADGFTYVEERMKRGLDGRLLRRGCRSSGTPPRLFFEIAASRRGASARHMRERLGAKRRESWLMRFHTQTAGCCGTSSPRTTSCARRSRGWPRCSAAPSRCTNSMDETTPSDKAVKIALRTQVIAHELAYRDADPLAGSYYLEHLTNRLEEQAEDYFRQIDGMGGVVRGIEHGFFQREIGAAAYQYQQEMEKKQRVIVGVNEYVEPDEKLDIPIMYIGEEVEEEQKRCIAEVKRTRHDRATTDALQPPPARGRARRGEPHGATSTRARTRPRANPRRHARGVRDSPSRWSSQFPWSAASSRWPPWS